MGEYLRRFRKTHALRALLNFVIILTMKVDLTKEFGPSSSGKPIIIASSEGNVAVDGHEEVKVGLNVYKRR
ncbi:MAG TPA: hypothetical protein VJZ49_14255 [Syntrophales bacterium]|nr:hypothetical protein [Syntrophales bacterium]